MGKGILQTSVQNRGLVLDPRTKLLLLFTMAVFVLGYMGGEKLQLLTPIFCILPAVFLLTAKKYKTAIGYILIYSASFLAFVFWGDKTSGIIMFVVKYNYRKLQMRIGECCISKLEKVAKHSLKTLRNGVAPEW